MKKVLLLIVSVLLLFSLCACSGLKEPYTVEEGWRTFEIDPEAKTISDEFGTYQYAISKNDDGFTLTITYPDGSTYYEKHWEHTSSTYVSNGHSDDYEEYRYVPGNILCDALEDELPAPFFPGNPALGFLLIVLGALLVLIPKLFWWLKIGWLLQGAQPAKYTLIVFQVLGVLTILFGIIKLFIA